MTERKTIFSPCRLYRYTLWREWNTGALLHCSEGTPLKPRDAYIQWIGLNPSTADETKDDPTIRRCIAFSKAWGYGAMCMTNLFAWRATDPELMKAQASPVGEGMSNDGWLKAIADAAGLIVCAWGRSGNFQQRGNEIIRLLSERGHSRKLHALRLLCDGLTPEHPLYLPKTLTPIPL